MPPLIPLISAGVGLAQSIIGAVKAKKAQNQLESLKSPTYKQNSGILDYYNQSLQRYNVSPTDSAMYKRQTRDIDRGVSQGISSLQDRRSGLAGTSSILRAANDAKLDANVAAEQQKNQRFNELGGATEMKAGEDRMAFNMNEQQPYERKYNLLAMKAGAANQTANAGISNIFNGLQNMNNTNLYNQEFGSGNSRNSSGNSRNSSGNSRNSSGNSRNSSGTSGITNTSQGVSTDWLLRNRKMKRP